MVKLANSNEFCSIKQMKMKLDIRYKEDIIINQANNIRRN